MEPWLHTVVDELREFLAGEDNREKAADDRAKAIIDAVQAAAKLQADATLRANQEVAAAIRDLMTVVRGLR